MTPRDDRGRFKKKRGWYVDDHGYPRFSAGPNRGKRVHRVVMEKVLKRPLAKDEDVHHRDDNKLNFHYTNLEVLGHAEHGFVSSKQRWYVETVIEPKLKAEWDEYFQERETTCLETSSEA